MRIVGGLFRSRTLGAPKGETTRPTTDRVREALFSILESRLDLTGCTVFDLYAGTGALGLEALSRGAGQCVFVEEHRSAIEALQDNIESLGVQRQSRILRMRVEAAAPSLCKVGSAQLIFADPPYADVSPHAAQALAKIRASFAASAERIWVLEHATKTATPTIAGLQIHESRRYGDTCLAFYADA